MKKFYVAYHTPVSIYENMRKETPEKQKERMQSWMNWYQENKSNLVDFGAPLINGKTLSSTDVSSSNKELSGYFIIQAESIDQAIALLQNHPHILSNETCTLEIHEIMPMPEM